MGQDQLLLAAQGHGVTLGRDLESLDRFRPGLGAGVGSPVHQSRAKLDVLALQGHALARLIGDPAGGLPDPMMGAGL